ncbi:MAG: Rrf2 family transcriptional regulator [Sphingomonadales bacterium]|nr:Rrf2 family transcriptional regulator [Sphingomonadales bacterium]
MFRFSKKMMYAVEAVVDIARHATTGPVQSKSLAQRHDIPERYLEQVMQRLVRSNILQGVRGPRGGYLLGREQSAITVGDIVSVVRDVDSSGESAAEQIPGGVTAEYLRPQLAELDTYLMERLTKITLEELVNQAVPSSVAANVA